MLSADENATSTGRTYSQCSSANVEMETNSPHSWTQATHGAATRSTAPPPPHDHSRYERQQGDGGGSNDDDDDDDDDECVIEATPLVAASNIGNGSSSHVIRRRWRDVDDSTDDEDIDYMHQQQQKKVRQQQQHHKQNLLKQQQAVKSSDNNNYNQAASSATTSVISSKRLVSDATFVSAMASSKQFRNSSNLIESSQSSSIGSGENQAREGDIVSGDDDLSAEGNADNDAKMGLLRDDEDNEGFSGYDDDVGFHSSIIGSILRALGWCASYWLLPLWAIAGCLDSGVLGLLYISMFVWVCFVPVVHRHTAMVSRVRDESRHRITVAFALAPTFLCLVMSALVAAAGLVLTGVHGVWWCREHHNHESDSDGAWTKAWSVLGFMTGTGGACSGEEDLGNHTWMHIVVFAASVLAIVGIVLQRVRDRDAPSTAEAATPLTSPKSWHLLHQHNTPFPIEWTPAGVVLLCMEIGGFVWIPWACAVVSIVLRPALLQIPDLIVCLAYVLWVERYAPHQHHHHPPVEQQQQQQQQHRSPMTAATPLVTRGAAASSSAADRSNTKNHKERARVWLAHRPTVLWRYVDRSFQFMSRSTRRELFWCRAYVVYIALSAFLYFACLSLMRMGYSLYGMEPEVLRFLSSLDVDRGAAVSQLILSCCSMFVVSIVIVLRAIDHEEMTGHEGKPRVLPRAHSGTWGSRTSAPILSALHRFLHHAWYVFEGVLVFCLANTAPSVFGCIWLLVWVVGLWAGSSQKQMHSAVVLLCTIQFVGFFVGDLHVYDPILDQENRDKAHVTVILGVRPYQRQDVELGIWILTVMLYNLCVLRYRRTRSHGSSRGRAGSDANDDRNSPARGSTATAAPRVRSAFHHPQPLPHSERSHTSHDEQTPLCSPKSGADGYRPLGDTWNNTNEPNSLRESFAGAAAAPGGYGTTSGNEPTTDPAHKSRCTSYPSSPAGARNRSSTMASYVFDNPRSDDRQVDEAPNATPSIRTNVNKPSKVNFNGEDSLAATVSMLGASSRRPLRREKSVVKIAVTTTEHYAGRLFQTFSELVRQYFYLVALAAIFVAAVARVNVLHLAFLVLFGGCLLRKKFSTVAWGLAVLYSVAVLVAQFVVVAFVRDPSQNLVQAGFTSSSGWDLWPYYLLSAIFLFQFRLYAVTSIAELSDNVRRYLELAERVTIGLVVWLNVIFFAVLAVMSHATLFALVYLSLFATSLVVFLESTALHVPSTRLLWYWYTVVLLNSICGVTVYVYQLFPELAEKTFQDIVRGMGLTLDEAGIADDSVAALWPKLASLLLCVVQARAWYARHGRAHEESGGSPATNGNAAQFAVAGFNAWSHTIFSSIMAAANTLALLLSRYSLPIAIVSLFFGSAFGVSAGYSGRSDPNWGGQSVVVQLLYFIIACWMTTLPAALHSTLLWRVVQVISGAATMATFVLQLPGYPHTFYASLWPTYILVGVTCAHDTMQWFVLLPHIVTFSAASIHATFLRNSKTQRPVQPSTSASTAAADSAVEFRQHPLLLPSVASTSSTPRGGAHHHRDPAAASTTDWRDYVFNPARHLRFFSFHASTGMMFINACVRRATFFGIFFFAMFVVVVLTGKTGMSRYRRWATLMIILLVVMCCQYVLHLRPPPYSSGGTADATVDGYRRMWMIMIDSFTSTSSVVGSNSNANSWLVQKSDLAAYFELKTPTMHLLLTIATWCAVVLHYVGLRVIRRGGRVGGGADSEEDDAARARHQHFHRMSVTDRLAKYQAIALARRHGAMEYFGRLLPLPKGRRDFTRAVGGNYFGNRTSVSVTSSGASPNAGGGGGGVKPQHKYQIWFDKLQLFLYQRSPLMVLIAMFLHAVYDGTTNLSVFKILSLLLVLMFLQNLHRLPWRGNRWWRFLTAFHGLWFALRLVMFIPRIVQDRWAVCMCQILGVLPHSVLVEEPQAQQHFNNGAGLHCPGAPYTLLEFGLQATILCFAVAQFAAFEKSDYIFVLHYLHQQDVFSKCVGDAIRQTRLALLMESKQMQVEEGEEMESQIEKILEVRRQRTASGGPGVASAFVDVARPSSVVDHNRYNSPRPSSRATVDPSAQPLIHVVDVNTAATTPRADEKDDQDAALHPHTRAEDDDSNDDFAHVHQNSEDTFQSSAEFRHLLDQTLDKRSLELLANIGSTSAISAHARRMEKRAARMSQQQHAAAVSGRPGNKTVDGSSFDLRLGNPSAATPGASLTTSFYVAREASPIGTTTVATATLSDATEQARGGEGALQLPTPRTDTSGGQRQTVTSTTLLRASTGSSAQTSNARHSVTAPVSTKRTGLRAAASLAWKSVLRLVDATILWLDRNSVGAGVVRLEQSMLAGHRVWFFLLGLYRCIFSFTHLLAYALYCLQFALAPCALNAVLPISVFGYAAMMNPRPHRGYWRFCLVYIQLMILAKCLIRIGYCEPHLVDDEGRAVQVQDPILDASWLYARTCTSDFFLVDVLFGLMCVLVTISHTAYLRAWGLWSDAELAPPATAAIIVDPSAALAAENSLSMPDVAKSIVHNLRRDDVKLGTDLYRFGFSCELLAVVIVFFGYYNLVGSADSLVNSLMNSLLPGMLAVLILLLFAFIVIDRVIYLKRAILGNVCFNVVYAIFYHVAMIWWFLHQTNFVRTYFRDSSFGVRGSLALASVVYFLKCGFMMCNAVQIRSGLRPHASHIAFTGSYSSWEFIVYMISRLIPFVFDMRVILDWAVVPTALKLPYWMKQEDVAHELYSLMCDREDTRVAREMNKNEKRAPYPGIFRYGIGWALFLLLTAVLMFPLFLYSSLSPVLKDNWVESVTCTLSLEGSPPLWSSASSLPKSTMSSTSGPPFAMNTTAQELMERVRPSLVNSLLSTDIVQQIPLNTFSNTLWAVSPPTLHDMLDALAHAESIAMLLSITIRNHAAIDASAKSNVMIQQTILTRETRNNISALLLGQQNSTIIPNLYTPFFTNRQSGTSSFEPINNGGNQHGNANTFDCKLTANGNVSSSGGGSNNVAYFSLSCGTVFALSNVYPGPWVLSTDEQACLSRDVCPNYEDVLHWNSSRFAYAAPTVIVDSSAVLGASFLQTIGLVAAYTTFVLAIGRVLRFATTGSAFRTALEDLDNPDDMILLLELIFFARSRGYFDMELELYNEMILLVKIDEDRHAHVMDHHQQGSGGANGGT